MKNGLMRLTFLAAFLFFARNLSAQSPGGEGSRLLFTIVLIVVVLIAFVVIVQVADNLMRIEARNRGIEKAGGSFSVFPSIRELFAPKLPDYADQSKATFLFRGHDILLEGQPEKSINNTNVSRFAVQPPNFIGMSPIPKLMVEIGDEVKAGDPIFFDKKNPDIKYVAPVSGEVIKVNRGEKRAITEVVILADKDMKYRKFESFDLDKKSREDLVRYLLESGVWPLIRQRPFNVIADPEEIPVNIFISTFDSAPLAPDINFVVEGKEDSFQKGLDVLNKLTSGNVYLGLDARADHKPSEIFTNVTGVEKHWFHGKHPSGNVGVQIHHLDPINQKDKVWTMGVQDVITLGALFREGRFNAERIFALTGAELKKPKYVKSYIGANVGELVKDNLNGGKIRLISGDVLSGQIKTEDNYLNIFDDQITAVTEGDYYEMFGWLLPQKATPTISKSFLAGLIPSARFEADTNMHGDKRAFVVTGQYESVLPMNIYVQQLMKNILINDFEKMEGLGIYELVEEDVALCEFACTSKQPLQKILREGLDLMREEG